MQISGKCAAIDESLELASKGCKIVLK